MLLLCLFPRISNASPTAVGNHGAAQTAVERHDSQWVISLIVVVAVVETAIGHLTQPMMSNAVNE